MSWPYGYFGDMYLSDKTKETMLKNIANQLGITKGYNIVKETKVDYSNTKLIKEGKAANTTISLVTMEKTDKREYEQYILVSVKMSDGVRGVDNLETEINNVYRDIGMDNTVNVYLKVSVAGKMSSEEKDNLVAQILEVADAKEVYREENNSMYSVYGYTRYREGYVYQQEEKVNINVAISYDPDKNISYIHVASPFINKSF